LNLALSRVLVGAEIVLDYLGIAKKDKDEYILFTKNRDTVCMNRFFWDLIYGRNDIRLAILSVWRPGGDNVSADSLSRPVTVEKSL
jgi:hypothetical protein